MGKLFEGRRARQHTRFRDQCHQHFAASRASIDERSHSRKIGLQSQPAIAAESKPGSEGHEKYNSCRPDRGAVVGIRLGAYRERRRTLPRPLARTEPPPPRRVRVLAAATAASKRPRRPLRHQPQRPPRHRRHRRRPPRAAQRRLARMARQVLRPARAPAAAMAAYRKLPRLRLRRRQPRARQLLRRRPLLRPRPLQQLRRPRRQRQLPSQPQRPSRRRRRLPAIQIPPERRPSARTALTRSRRTAAEPARATAASPVADRGAVGSLPRDYLRSSGFRAGQTLSSSFGCP